MSDWDVKALLIFGIVIGVMGMMAYAYAVFKFLTQ